MTAGRDERVDVVVEKPAAGGRMIARHDGRVILVAGAIPGERVRVRIERLEKRVAFAAVERVLEASPDRQAPPFDGACGGCTYNHIRYPRQTRLKAEVIADAFARLGRLPLAAGIDVAGSPPTGYRMRARFHVRAGRAGFYREGTHTLCDPAGTGQLHAAAVPAVERVVRELTAAGLVLSDLEMSDTLQGEQRAIHVTVARGTPSPDLLAALLGPAITTVSAIDADGRRSAAGPGQIADPLAALTSGRAAGTLRRSAEAFFQANRFLLPSLVSAVLDAALPDGGVLDLYAGVGLFAMALAGSGRESVVAVEGAGASGADLEINAAAMEGRAAAVLSPVERYLARRPELPPTVIVDPPRTGLSPQVADALIAGRPRRLIYVSCDPATLARDSRLLVDGGMRLASLRGFDLFPNTPHVEALAVFEGGAA